MKTLFFLLTFALTVVASAASPELIVMADGNKVTIPPEDQKRVIQKIEAIVLSANFNSRDHADMFASPNKEYWRPLKKILSGSHICLRYSTPNVFSTVGGKITAAEVWVDLQKQPRMSGGAVYPGPITLVNGEECIRLTKEGGYLLLGFGLDPAIYPHLPKVIQENMDRSRKAYEEYKKENKG